MTRATTAWRLATGAAYGGGGLGLAGAGMLAVLRQQARSARRRVESNNLRGDPPSGERLLRVFATPRTTVVAELGVSR